MYDPLQSSNLAVIGLIQPGILRYHAVRYNLMLYGAKPHKGKDIVKSGVWELLGGGLGPTGRAAQPVDGEASA